MLWPENAKIAVCLTGDVDSSPEISSGQTGVIFDILDDYGVPYTFPVTAKVLTEVPDRVTEIVAHGDEVAGHGDVHLRFGGQPYDVQLARVRRTVEMFRSLAGIEIRGFRAPYLDGDIITTKAIADSRLLYDSTWKAGEVWLRVGRELVRVQSSLPRAILRASVRLPLFRHAKKRIYSSQRSVGVPHLSSLTVERSHELLLPFYLRWAGKPIKALQIPVSNMDDRSLIEVGPRYRDWRKVASVWIRNFEYYRRHNGVYVLLAHPLRIGTRQYSPALRAFIEQASSRDAWFATLTELYDWWEGHSVSTEQPTSG